MRPGGQSPRALFVNLLGGFSVAAPGPRNLLSFERRKSRALLAILSLCPGRMVARGKLASLLWHERSEDGARQGLRQCLLDLRRTLARDHIDAIRVEGDLIGLDPSTVVDAARLEWCVARGTLEALKEAVALYHGDLLEGFSLGERTFEDWLSAERQRLRALAVSALQTLLAHHMREPHSNAALQVAARLLTFDPLDETVHRALMRFYAETGRRRAALRQYEACVALLARDLGVEPEAETRELYRLVADQAFSSCVDVRRTGPPIRSLAVLPLVNLSGDPSQEYFADSMTDALITELAQIPSLLVISRTSVMRYKRTNKRLADIARELNVAAFVEGSVTRSGDRVRISAQLVEAKSGVHLWARSYEHKVRDTVVAQRDLARSIARELRVEVTPRHRDSLVTRSLIAPDAHDLLLKARFLNFQWASPDNVKLAIQYYERAIAKDSAYATAHAGLAQAQLHIAAAIVEGVSPLEVLPKARASARKALDLDQAEVEAHVAFGWINALNDWDWAAAERAFSRAIELDPSHAQAHMLLSHHFNVMGRHREALVLIERARALNPLSAHVLWSVPQAHLHLGAFEQAEAECRAAIDLHPDFWPLHTLLGSIFVWQGRADRALPILREGVELSRRHPHALAVSGAAHGLFGRQEAARQLLTELSELSQRRYFSPAEMAWVHAGLGENELALSSLGKAYTERSPWMTRLRLQGPLLGTLPSDSRFRRLLRQMNFPP